MSTTHYRIVPLTISTNEWSEETGMGEYITDQPVDHLACEAETMRELNEHLAKYDLPPLREWDWMEEVPGMQLSTNKVIHEHDGDCLYDYIISVEVLTIEIPSQKEIG